MAITIHPPHVSNRAWAGVAALAIGSSLMIGFALDDESGSSGTSSDAASATDASAYSDAMAERAEAGYYVSTDAESSVSRSGAIDYGSADALAQRDPANVSVSSDYGSADAAAHHFTETTPVASDFGSADAAAQALDSSSSSHTGHVLGLQP